MLYVMPLVRPTRFEPPFFWCVCWSHKHKWNVLADTFFRLVSVGLGFVVLCCSRLKIFGVRVLFL
jgi:hypothetical protein